MIEKEFNLSKKAKKYIHEVTGKELRETFDLEDVKEFIKRETELIESSFDKWKKGEIEGEEISDLNDYILKKRKKLVGDKLR